MDNVPSPPVCEEEGPLLRFLREVLHELPFLSSGCAGALPVPVAEAVPARVQTAQVQAGEGEQEETGLRKSGSAQLSCHLLLSCETLTGHCGFLFWKKIFELLSDATVKVLLNRAVIGLRFGFSVCFNCSAFYVCINIHQAYIIVMLLLRV